MFLHLQNMKNCDAIEFFSKYVLLFAQMEWLEIFHYIMIFAQDNEKTYHHHHHHKIIFNTVELIFHSQIQFELSLDTELNKHPPDWKTKEIFEKKNSTSKLSSFCDWVFLRVSIYLGVKIFMVFSKCKQSVRNAPMIIWKIRPKILTCAQYKSMELSWYLVAPWGLQCK